MFDTVCKFLVETFLTDFAAWLLGDPIALTELGPLELSLELIRADASLIQTQELKLRTVLNGYVGLQLRLSVCQTALCRTM
jgi:predicted transposase YdaD